jgi:hypothetical protein
MKNKSYDIPTIKGEMGSFSLRQWFLFARRKAHEGFLGKLSSAIPLECVILLSVILFWIPNL